MNLKFLGLLVDICGVNPTIKWLCHLPIITFSSTPSHAHVMGFAVYIIMINYYNPGIPLQRYMLGSGLPNKKD